MSEFQLDCCGLNCPMPIVKIAKAFRDLQIGQTLEVKATDPAFRADVEAWVRKTGQQLIRYEEGPVKIALIQKVK